MLQTILIVVCLALAVVTAALAVRAVRSMLSVIRLGQSAVGRSDNPGRRAMTMLKETVLHTRMLQWTWVGILHWFAFAAFIVLSTAVGAAFIQLFDVEWTIPVIGKFFAYEWIAEGLGLLGALAIIPLTVYRLRNLPANKGRKSRFFGSTMWQAYFVEAMVLLESAAILFIRGAEYNLAQAHGGEHAEHATGFHFPISQYFGNLYPTGANSIDTLETIILLIAGFKIISALLWVIVVCSNLTMGVAWHRFTVWFNIFYKRESIGRDTDGATTALGALKPLTSGGKAITLDDIDDLDEEAVLGVGTIQDFSWKGILDFTTCTECGRCQSQCPAWNTEKPLSPKLLMMGLREHAYASAPYLLEDGSENTRAQLPLIGKTDKDASVGAGEEVLDWFYNPTSEDGSTPFVIDEDVLWSCTSCGACVQQCPVDIEHVDHIVDMRRYQVLVESNFPAELNGLFRGLENNGNPWNMSSKQRLAWTEGLDFDVKVVGDDIEDLDSVEWLFWVGCAGAYEDRAKKTTRAVAELLNIAGVSFGVLGNGETCTGDSARRAGNEFVFQGLAQQNVETFKEYKVKKVVSTCAHCFNTLKNEYKEFGIELEVVHHTQLLNRLVREGKLTPVAEGAGAQKRSITYHDPCYIGRHNGVYNPPRELLQILPGAEIVEMPRNSERSFCCGAGGARMWMEEKLGSRINQNRTDEAVATGADQIAVGCPFCRVMLADGLTSAQANGSAREEVEVLDVAQMLLSSVKGEQATKLAPGHATAAAPVAAPVAAASASAAVAETLTAPDDASSLFDSPAPTEVAAAPAAPATDGGSLFGDSGSLFGDAPAEPEKPAGDSLFDLPAAPVGESTPVEESPVEAPAPEASAPAVSSSGAASVPRTDIKIDEIASLFDIPAPDGAVSVEAGAAAPAPVAAAPAAPVAPATPVITTTTPAAPAVAAGSGVGSVPHTDVKIDELTSLFDIAAPEGAVSVEPGTAASSVAAVAAPVGAAPAEAALVAEAPAAPVAEAPAAIETPAQAPTPAPAAPAPVVVTGTSSGTASAPHTDVKIDELASLFDITAPEGAVSVEAGTTPAAVVAAPVAAAPAAKAPATEAPVALVAPVVEAPAVAATPVAETPAAPAVTIGESSGATHEPRTDVDINTLGSLFDI